ncbi:MAG: N-acetyltransferase [Chlorobiaceae bacterium]|nr:N-acetyltransferase [Chlorobiaceae bacterium]
MPVRILPSVPEDREEMARIFNHYVEHSFATYTETPVPADRFDAVMSFHDGWPAFTAWTDDGVMAGFGLLRPYSFIPAFEHVAELSCFIRQGMTGMGIGTAILAELESAARQMGVASILATVSSLNDRSILFHRSCGFCESGRLTGVGRKRGVVFDVVLLQKHLQ